MDFGTGVAAAGLVVKSAAYVVALAAVLVAVAVETAVAVYSAFAVGGSSLPTVPIRSTEPVLGLCQDPSGLLQ
jgi:hypothetical protein